MTAYFDTFRSFELKQLMTGPMWAGAANRPIGRGDPDLERAEAAGLLYRTDKGFALTPKGRAAIRSLKGGDGG